MIQPRENRAPARVPLGAAFAAGMLGEQVAILFSHPCDTLKVRMQVGGVRGSLADELAHLARGGLWRGLTASQMRQLFLAPRHGSFAALSPMLSEVFPDRPLASNIVCGLLVGATFSVIVNGADVVLVRMQRDSIASDVAVGAQRTVAPPKADFAYSSGPAGLVSLVSSEGFASLFRGLSMQLTRTAAITGSQIPTYNFAKNRLSGMFPGAHETVVHLASSVAAASAMAIVSCPIDFVKNKIMSTVDGGAMTPISCIKDTIAKEGPLAFYRGLAPLYFRLLMHNIPLWLSIEYFSKILR